MSNGARGNPGSDGPPAITTSKPYCFNCDSTNHNEEDCPDNQEGSIPAINSFNKAVPSNRAAASPVSSAQSPQEWGRVERSGADSSSAASQSSVPLFRPPSRKQKNLKPATHAALEQLYKTGEKSRNPVGENFARYTEDTVRVIPEKFHGLKRESFEDFDLAPPILEIVKRKYETPLPIQQYAAGIIDSGRNLKASARTGCGKTAAFLLPIINHVVKGDVRVPNNLPQSPKVLIIAPTRELAQQIYTDATSFAALTDVKIRLCHGHAVIYDETKKLASGTNILIATLGRVVDHLVRDNIKLGDLRYLVFDEADRLLEEDFADSIGELMQFIEGVSCKPQTLLFSATFPDGIMSRIDRLFEDHVSLQVGIPGTVSDDIEQIVLPVREDEKRDKLLEIIREEPSRNFKTIVFVRTRERADMLNDFLFRKKVLCTVFHAEREQLERNKALRDFNDGRRNVMVATLIASRGLDVTSVNHVINYDLPSSIEQYINCLGRTGRVGNRGKATSFFDSEFKDDRAIASDLKQKLTEGGACETPDFLDI